MPFQSRYLLRNFKQFLEDEERQLRHLFHENAHEWVGLSLGGEKVSRDIQFHGESKVVIQGLKSPENYIQVALAGMLGEAKGIKNEMDPDCKFDLGARFKAFAHELYETVRHWPSDPNSSYGIEPEVPMTCPRASTEWGGLSVADLARPIAFGLTEDRLYEGLFAVAQRMNTDEEWDEFLTYHNKNNK